MPEKNIDLHGSAPDKHRFALLLIDVMNDFDFPEADELLKHARPMARILLRLKRRAQKAGVPVIYVNDNFGQWKSDFRRTVDHCVTQGRGRDVVNYCGQKKAITSCSSQSIQDSFLRLLRHFFATWKRKL